MLINNEHVTGIFLYSEDAEYEKNDFIVLDDSIYVCLANNPTDINKNTVSGIMPSKDTRFENFMPYLGSRTISSDEFFDYIENNKEVEDKYVSSRDLISIFQRFQFGLSMTGVIEDYIGPKGECSLNFPISENKPLDDIMLTENLNNGVLRVSPKLSQLVDNKYFDEENNISQSLSYLFGILNIEDDLGSYPDDQYTLLLRQYTYQGLSEGTNYFYRIQELISPMSGMIAYRYMFWSPGEFPVDGNNIGEWRNAYSYSSNISDRLNAIISYYRRRSIQAEERLENLEKTFRFRQLEKYVESGQNSAPEGSYFDDSKVYNIDDNTVYTLTVLGLDKKTGFFNVLESITINSNLKSIIGESSIELNNIEGRLVFQGNNISLSGVDSENTKIIDVYYRENYGQ